MRAKLLEVRNAGAPVVRGSRLRGCESLARHLAPNVSQFVPHGSDDSRERVPHPLVGPR